MTNFPKRLSNKPEDGKDPNKESKHSPHDDPPALHEFELSDKDGTPTEEDGYYSFDFVRLEATPPGSPTPLRTAHSASMPSVPAFIVASPAPSDTSTHVYDFSRHATPTYEWVEPDPSYQPDPTFDDFYDEEDEDEHTYEPTWRGVLALTAVTVGFMLAYFWAHSPADGSPVHDVFFVILVGLMAAMWVVYCGQKLIFGRGGCFAGRRRGNYLEIPGGTFII